MRASLLSLLTLLVVGCSSGSDSSGAGASCSGSVLNGVYSGTVSGNADTMTLNSSCSVTSTYCSSTGVVPNVSASSGSLIVTVTSTNGNTGCLPAGSTTCAYLISGATLTFNCGGSTLTYTKM